MAAVSTISTMKVERPRARLSDGADAAEQAVDDADLGARGGNEAARLREHGDQRGLAQEGRLAAHVGAGDQPQPVVRAQAQIVGDEPLAGIAERAFDDRVASASISRQASSVSCGRHQPPSAARCAWPAATSIRAIASAVAVIARRRGDRRARSAPRRARPRRRARGRRPRPRGCLVMQVGRIEADDAGERLAMGEAAIGRHQPVGVPRRRPRHDSRAPRCGGS